MTTFAQRKFQGDAKLRICEGTGAVPIGEVAAANSIALLGILIQPAAAPITATIAGFFGETSAGVEAADTIVLTGPDADAAAGGPITAQFYDFFGAVNEAGACTVTASVDEGVVVFYRNL